MCKLLKIQIMKNIKEITLVLVLLFFASSILSSEEAYPKPTNFANDFAGVLSAQTLRTANNLSKELKQKTGFELTVAIVPDMQGEDLYTYANKLYESWGIGSQNDEGVLLFVAIKERKMKIETGYGAEGFLPDGLCGQIADQYMVPFLQKDDYNSAILNGIAVLAGTSANHYGVQLTGIPQDYGVKKGSGINLFKFIFGLIIVALFISGRIGLFPLLLLSGMGGFRGGWSSGSNGFGGFGGFGGGFSGGGGAGRSF